jgi:hypothetical protein
LAPNFTTTKEASRGGDRYNNDRGDRKDRNDRGGKGGFKKRKN